MLFKVDKLPASFEVIIPAYNAQQSICNAIQSALSAGASRVLVVDDGSTDSTALIASENGAEVLQQKNAGAAAARRAGIMNSKGNLCILLDADDWLVPSGVHTSMNLAQSRRDSFSVIVGGTSVMSRDGSIRATAPWREAITTESLLKRGYGPSSPAAMLWNVSTLRKVMSDEIPSLWPKYAEDYEMLIRASLYGPILMHANSSAVYQSVGGKSAGNALASITCAEEIRKHYATISNVSIRRRNRSEINAMARVREAAAFTPWTPAWVLQMMRVSVASPRVTAHFLSERLSRMKS